MTTRMLEEERINEEIPPQVEQAEQVPQDRQGIQGAQVPPQGDHVPNLEGGNEVSVVPSKFTNREIREALFA